MTSELEVTSNDTYESNMRKNLLSAIATISLASCTLTSTSDNNDILWYDEPATIWEESLPLGNGRLGLMPDGGVMKEHVVLNEISMWSGSEADYSNPKAAESLPKIRQLLFEGKNHEAQELMYETFVPKTTSGGAYGAYQMLGDLNITYEIDTTGGIDEYKRMLDMQRGIATTDIIARRNRIHKEYIASRKDDIIAINLKSDQAISFTIKMTRKERSETHAEGNKIVMSGRMDSGQSGVEGVGYRTILTTLEGSDGKQTYTDEGLRIEQARDVTLLISARTSYLSGDKYQEATEDDLTRVSAKTYEDIKRAHVEEHRELYDRVKLDIRGNGDASLATDERILRYAETADPEMAELYYNFGRYSLISSTREGSLPPNLQGLWANECGTPWNGDYHTNINVQMNHWPLEQGNLDELYEPLVELMERSVASGEKTAKAFYGQEAKGWVMHMMTNVWRFTAPGEHPSWGATNTGGAWMCEHLWERYEYTQDTTYLRRIYPVMRGASEFFQSTMVREPKHGWKVTAPSSSPENAFILDGNDQPTSVCMAPTMDIEIVRELYSNVIKAAEILGIDDKLTADLKRDLEDLPPLQIAEEGYLQEWLEDYKEVDIHHRHVSHLYGLHPSNQISPIETPELAEACRETLERRGDGGTGWSRAWKINFWARLFDGNRAERLLKSLFSTAIEADGSHRSGTFPNLWCSHPPFQLDGNFGGAAGIGEMLLQSHMGYINPLPALPDTWSEGRIAGMRVRGGAEVGMTWADSRLRTMSLHGGAKDAYSIVIPSNISAAYINGKKASMRDYHGTRIVDVKMDNGEATLTFE